jgi:Domain of unknown function (DUF4216)
VRVHHRHGLIEVKYTFTCRSGEPFVLACQANQVYYLSYASKKRERYQWWIAMKVKRKGKLDSEEMYVNSIFFQEEQTNGLISISVGQDFDSECLVIEQHQYEMITKDRLSTRTYVEN